MAKALDGTDRVAPQYRFQKALSGRQCVPPCAHGDRKSTRLNSSHYLPDALPILKRARSHGKSPGRHGQGCPAISFPKGPIGASMCSSLCSWRSEEHTSELQSLPTRRSSDLEAGKVPWQKPWTARTGLPRNLVSKRPYRGVNVFLLVLMEIGRAHV